MADTPEQRPDDTPLDPDRAELPADLWPLHERLNADGLRWRRRIPDGRDLPAWARATLLIAAPATEPATDTLRERRLDAHDEHPYRPKGPRSLMDASNNSARARWRGFAGAAAAVVVVGLLAALLVHNGAQRGPAASATSTPPPTPTPCPSQPPETPLLPNGCPAATPGQQPVFLQPGQLPVIAPSNPSIVYRIVNNVPQRSTDGGKSFTTTTQPKSGLSEVDYTGLAVSPLDASTVFFSAGGLKNGQGCPPPQSYGATALHGGVLASGFIPCSAQLISRDGGQSWHTLSLPIDGALGGVAGFRAMMSGANGAQQYTIQAQGQRLYSAAAFSNQGGSLVDSPGARLVASDDGGATWSLIDDALVRSGVVCDFAASPTGTTIYATTSPGSCASETFPPITLWRSDDGGQSWRGPIRNLPTLAETGMVVSRQGWLYTYTPVVVVQGHGASSTSTPASAIVSQDGGLHFTSAPIANLPAKDGLSGPFATLSDGSVIFGLQSADPVGANDALYSWKPGASAWTKLSGAIQGGVVAVLVAPAAAGGDTLTIVTGDGVVISLSTPK